MSISLTGDQINALARLLDPADNSTGGGTASALAGAMAAALVAMVARLSKGTEAPEPAGFYADIAAAGSELSQALLFGAEEDACAFDGVMAAYRLPKDTPEAGQARKAAIQSARAYATQVPLHNAESCAQVLPLVARLEGRSNPRAASDLQSAGFLARAGLQGCLANVDINLPGIRDEAVAGPIRARAEALAEALRLGLAPDLKGDQGAEDPAV